MSPAGQGRPFSAKLNTRPSPIQPMQQSPQHPQITIQSTGPVRIVVAGVSGPLGLHAPPASVIMVMPGPEPVPMHARSVEFARRAERARTRGDSLPRFAVQTRQWASAEEASWAAEAAADGLTMRQFAELAQWRTTRPDWGDLAPRHPQSSARGAEAVPEASDPTDRTSPGVTLSQRFDRGPAPGLHGEDGHLRVFADFEGEAAPRAPVYPGGRYSQQRQTRSSHQRGASGFASREAGPKGGRRAGRRWRLARDPPQGTREYAAAMAVLDLELEEYMAAGGLRDSPKTPGKQPEEI